MLPLYLRFCPEIPLLRRRRKRCVGLVFGLGCSLIPTSVPAQDAPALAPVSPPGVNLRERPKYPSDPPRLRRTVQIDGVLNDNEWNAFYTVTEGPIRGTVYCNWDNDNLYLATRTEQAASLLINVDTSGDGWLRGADNLELVVGSLTEGGGVTRAARLLDAANSKDTPTWNEKVIDPNGIQIAAKIINGTQIIEIAIPKNTASLVLRPGVALGLRVEFLPAGPAAAYAPTPPFEPHLLLDAKLVDTLIQGVPGINPRLTLSDNVCVAGQNLFATLELLNQTDAVIPLRSVTWEGQGNSSNAVNTLREVTVPPIPALKRNKYSYKTPLPPNLTPGSYSLTVTADAGEGKLVQSSATFTVVEPLQAQLSSDPEPVAVVGPTKLKVIVDVYSFVPRNFRGDAELTAFPAGWELEGKPKRTVTIDRENARKLTQFTLKLPAATPAGDYPFEANVTYRGRAWKLKHVARVVRTNDPAPAAPTEKKP